MSYLIVVCLLALPQVHVQPSGDPFADHPEDAVFVGYVRHHGKPRAVECTEKYGKRPFATRMIRGQLNENDALEYREAVK